MILITMRIMVSLVALSLANCLKWTRESQLLLCFSEGSRFNCGFTMILVLVQRANGPSDAYLGWIGV